MPSKRVPLAHIKLRLAPDKWRHFENYMLGADPRHTYWCVKCDMPYCTCECLMVSMDMGGNDYPHLILT